MTHATVVTPPGVGDAIWVYQKLAPYFDTLTFRMVEYGGGPRALKRRAEGLIRGLSKVSAVEYVVDDVLRAELATHKPLAAVLTDLRAGKMTTYAVNPALEAGVYLEDIDPGSEVMYDYVPVGARPPGTGDPKTFIVLYVSGDSVRHAHYGEEVWTPDRWVRFVVQLFSKHQLDRHKVGVTLVGAGFDHPVVGYLYTELERRGFGCMAFYDLPMADLTWLFANCRLFAGYQSGLNVVADAVGAYQTMVYFPQCAPVGATWVKPAHRRDRFRYDTFAASPEAVASRAVLAPL